MRLYLILILGLSAVAQSTNLYQQQPALQQSRTQALLEETSSNAALLSSQASSTAQAASIAAATTASIASALSSNAALSSYPFALDGISLADWNQFAASAWSLGMNANFDLWASKQFNNAWIGDWSSLLASSPQFQLPTWVDSSSQSQWNIWAKILCAQRNLNSQSALGNLNLLNLANGNSLLDGWNQGNNNQWLLQGNGLGNINSGLLSSLISNGNTFAYNNYYAGPQPSGAGPWSGQFSGWTQSNGVWYNNHGVGWYQDTNGDWYTTSSAMIGNGVNFGYNGHVYVGPQPTGSGPWNGQTNGWTQNNGWWYNNNQNNGVGWYKDNNGNWFISSGYSSGYSNDAFSGSGSGVYVGPQPTGSGPWNGQYNGWTQNNGWWYNSNGNGWYQDNQGNWYTSNSNGNTGYGIAGYGNTGYGNTGYGNTGYGNTGYGNTGYGNTGAGTYIGPQPTGAGPWNGQYNGWTQSNGWWYNGNGNGWYQDSQGNWYTSSSNGNTGYGSGVFVGTRPSGSGPWNGVYNGWSQSSGSWYDNNGNRWYQDNSGNWYRSDSYYGASNNIGRGIFVGPNPSGTGPWNGQYSGWTQKNNWWYNSNGVGWYQDTNGNWYTSTNMNSYNGNPLSGFGEAQGVGAVTSTQCVSTTVGQTNATLSCPSGSVVVSVLGAAYGSNPGSCPSSVNTLNAACTLNITQLIQKTCQGQNQCSVTVQPNILGAPTNNGQQCSTSSIAGPYSTTNQYTMVAQYTCGIAGPGGVGTLNSTSLTFSPPNSAQTSSYSLSFVLASLFAILLTMA